MEAVFPEVKGMPASAVMADYLELTKPRLTALVLVTAAVGFCMGSAGGFQWLSLLHVVAGTALVAGGASAFNQILERDTDARMRRTRERPLPAGRLHPGEARVFASVLSMSGAAYLATLVNARACILGGIAWVSYVLIYTPLKKRTPFCTLVGAIPGAIPPVMGWVAATNSVGKGAWSLFAILFAWQIPHFLALAQMYRDDYGRVGFPMLPVVDAGGNRTALHILAFGLALLGASLTPSFLGLTGKSYLAGALVLSLAFFAVGANAVRCRTRPAFRQLFLASIAYLPLLLTLMVADKISP
ncbi:MAG: protoheme IX farnesyltransferase [Verrucomicrobia bacterium]|nr:protoheme IX farnesyltransferase [Verrucomicrobiota bacterium]